MLSLKRKGDLAATFGGRGGRRAGVDREEIRKRAKFFFETLENYACMVV
jgi:hypothetical protein